MANRWKSVARGLGVGVLSGFALAAMAPVGCGSSSSGGGDASADASTSSQNGCVSAGGTCGCGCGPGTKLASAPLRDQCPQPCPQCGACSQQCCLPDPAEAGADATKDAAADAACTGTFNCLCGTPYCDDGQWKCTSCAGDAAGE